MNDSKHRTSDNRAPETSERNPEGREKKKAKFVAAARLRVVSAVNLLARIPLMVLVTLTLAGDSFGKTSTQSTDVNQIGPTTRSEAGDRPAAPNVCVQHTITVDSDTGEAKLKAKFTNKDGTPKQFVFCQMAGVDGTEHELNAACDIGVDEPNQNVKCTPTTRPFDSFVDNFHFGCKAVTVAGDGTTEIDYGSGQHEKFEGKKASDFLLTYADYIELPAGFTFDAASCAACFGKDKTTGVSGGPAKFLGDWYLPKLPFDDPFIVSQDISGKIASAPEYLDFSSNLHLPSDFDAMVAQLPPNTPGPVPSSYSVPINLFDIYTMNADPNETFPAEMTIEVTGAPELEFSTTPPTGVSFVMTGEAEDVGELTISRLTELPEGSTTSIEIAVHEPDGETGTGDAYFTQKGTFIHDRTPPTVTSDAVNLAGQLLDVTVTASDISSGPLSADIWFSTDDGATWNSQGLESTTSLFDEATTRTFEAHITLPTPATSVGYFITVQDAVFNVVFYGVGSAAAVQTRAERVCTNELNKNFAKVVKAQGKEMVTCIKDGSKGQLTGPMEQCLTSDRKGKVGKAQQKTRDKAEQKCLETANFGASDATTVNNVAVQKELDLIHEIFGSDLDATIILVSEDPSACQCQSSVTKLVTKCQDAKLKEFNKCKKNGLRGKVGPPGAALPFGEADDLELCMGFDPRGKIAKACVAKLGNGTNNSKCQQVALSLAFPGCGTDDPGALAICLDRIVECQVCLALNEADTLARDCDDFDDGMANGSCSCR